MSPFLTAPAPCDTGPRRKPSGPEEVRAAMRPYEVMVIFDVDLEEAGIRALVERVLEVLRERGGTPGQVDYWGRRTFAYELKHRSEGFYVLIEATAEPDAMAEVDRMLTLEDSVLRHKVLRQPEKAAGRRSAPRQPRRPSAGGNARGSSEARSASPDTEPAREQAAG